jgi:hypothetical protein
MTTIHDLSSITPHPDFDLFGVLPTQLTIENDIQSEYRPLSVISSSSPIQFEVRSAFDEYIQLRDTLFKIKLKIDIATSDNSAISEAVWKKIAPINYLMNSLFSYINVEFDNKSIILSPHTYSYKAYFDALLKYSKSAKDGYLGAAGFYDDKNTKSRTDLFTDAQSTLIQPTTKTSGTGIILELEGKLHIDLAMQPKALLGGVNMKITLIPNEPSFYLMTKDAKIIPSVEFIDATLFIHKSKVSWGVVEAHNAALQHGRAKYCICRTDIKSFNVNSGTTDVSIDNAIHGWLPRRIIVAMIPNSALSGSLSHNSFDFKNYKLNYITAHIDGQQYPKKAYTPDFEKHLTTREYLGFLESFNQLGTNPIIDLTKEQWEKGNTIFGFNFAPDLGEDCGKMGFANLRKSGALKLEMKFADALTDTISVLIGCEFDDIIEFDENRQVYTTYM